QTCALPICLGDRAPGLEILDIGPAEAEAADHHFLARTDQRRAQHRHPGAAEQDDQRSAEILRAEDLALVRRLALALGCRGFRLFAAGLRHQPSTSCGIIASASRMMTTR